MTVTHDMIRRLSRYKTVLKRLKSLGFVKVFSDNLGDALGISASLVRKDFASFGITGNKRGGYQVEALLVKLYEILGKNCSQQIIVVGCGKIGTALIDYNNFKQDGIKVVAGFDVASDIITTEGPAPIYDISELEEFIRREQIQIAILAVPESAAAHTADTLIHAGIKGILNFAPIQLKGPSNCIIRNINIRMEIEHLFCLIHFQEKDEAINE
ncbi:MAG: redox-sensing transcriptional repressor Rex [Spartobacteria bacterium]|nr:redox-sensing transcriptional repressor Rex [Spartobacteria bacterium]